MKKRFYPNCSELIADFKTDDVETFYPLITNLIKENGWRTEPRITKELLTAMITPCKTKKESSDRWYGAHDTYNDIKVTIYDKEGNHTTLTCGSNGYDDELGFRLDSECNHADEAQYNFFKQAVKSCEAEIRTYDGGHTEYYEDWCVYNADNAK